MKKTPFIWIIGFVLLTSLASALLGSGTPNDPYNISSCLDLNRTSDDLAAYYQLTQDIDCSDTINWDNGKGFSELLSSSPPFYFSGNLEGNGKVISNIYINRPNEEVGLFYALDHGGNISNLGITNITIFARNGGAIGGNYIANSIINNCYVIGNIYFSDLYSEYGGGFTSYVDINSIINNSYFIGNISGNVSYMGGLAGYLATTSSIENSWVNANISSLSYNVGGLVGYQDYLSLIKKSFSTGSVSAYANAGGLVGQTLGTIVYSYSSSNVNAVSQIGGLVGYLDLYSIINDSYFSGSVTGTSSGGIYGWSRSGTEHGIVLRTYSTGNISGTNSRGVGGIVNAVIHDTSSTWDSSTNGLTEDVYSSGCTKEQIHSSSTFVNKGWDMIKVWGISGSMNNRYPYLRWQDDSAKYLTFDGTDFNAASDKNNISNAQLSKSGSTVAWNSNINVAGADFDSNTAFGFGFVSINVSKFDPSINTSAVVTLHVGGCGSLVIYHASEYYTSLSDIISNGVDCTTDGSCSNVQCNNGVATFTVNHFDGFGGLGGVVPEFSTITTIIALTVVLSGFIIIRKRGA